MSRLPRTLAGILLCAALCVVAWPHAALAQGAPPGPTPQEKAQAMKKFREGRAAFAKGRFEEALAALRESYNVVPSPNSHLMIVHALTELGRKTEAFEEARAVAAEADAAAAKNRKYAKTATAARDELDKLRSSVGVLAVQVSGVDDPEQATLTVAGNTIDSARWGESIAVEPGSVEVELTTPDGTTTRRIEVAAGDEKSLTIKPTRPTAQAPPSEEAPLPEEPEEEEGQAPSDLRVPAIVGLSIGGVGMVSFAIFGGLTLKEFSDMEERCPSNSCAASLDDEADAGRTYQTVANVSLVVGLVGLSAGATLLIVDLTSDSEQSETAHRGAPSVAVGPGSIAVTGTF